MKRILCVLLVVINTGIIYGQQLGTNCDLKQEVKATVETNAAVGRYLQGIKTTYPDDQWDSFISRLGKGETLTAFDAFGANAETIRSGYLTWANELQTAMTLCLDKIRAAGIRSTEGILRKINAELDCFYADTLLNNLATLMERAGEPQPAMALGPCEKILERCLRTAESTYNRQFWECSSAGIGGVWGLVGSLLCHSAAGQQHFDAIMNCRSSFIKCRDREAY